MAAWVAAGGVGGCGLVWLALTGRLTVDLGWGRTLRPLGPITIEVPAPVEIVFDVIAQPYLGRPTHAMAEKVKILERTDAMVLAEHHTPLTPNLRAVTVETVSFDRPHHVSFRLVRGPVPYVSETFTLSESVNLTRLEYRGELGTDLGPLGARWGRGVARHWEDTVQATLDRVAEEARRRARTPPAR